MNRPKVINNAGGFFVWVLTPTGENFGKCFEHPRAFFNVPNKNRVAPMLHQKVIGFQSWQRFSNSRKKQYFFELNVPQKVLLVSLEALKTNTTAATINFDPHRETKRVSSNDDGRTER